MVAANSAVSASGRRRGPGRPFVKGQSGNPNGRPKADFDLRNAARKYGPRCIETLAKMAGLTDEPPAAAEPVRLGALKELLDRGFGKPTTVLAGDDVAGPMQIEFRWRGEGEEPKLTIDSSSVSECAEEADADTEADADAVATWGNSC